MVIHNRKIGQSIIIDDNIVVKVLDENHGQIKIGIDAPGDVLVHKDEVYQWIKENDTWLDSLN